MKQVKGSGGNSSKRQRLEPAVYSFHWPDPVLDSMFDFQLVQFSSLCKRFRDRAEKRITARLFRRLMRVSIARIRATSALCGLISGLVDRGSLTVETVQLKLAPHLYTADSGYENVIGYPLLAGERFDPKHSPCYDLWTVYHAGDRHKMYVTSWGSLACCINGALREGMKSEVVADLILNSLLLGPQLVNSLESGRQCLDAINTLVLSVVPIVIIDALATMGKVRGRNLIHDSRQENWSVLPSRSYLLSVQQSGAVDITDTVDFWLLSPMSRWDENLQSLVDHPMVTRQRRQDEFGFLASIALKRAHPSLYNDHPWLTPDMLVESISHLNSADIQKHGLWIIERINPTAEQLSWTIFSIISLNDPIPLLKACSKLKAFPASVAHMIRQIPITQHQVFILLDYLDEMGLKTEATLDSLSSEKYVNWRKRSAAIKNLFDSEVNES